MDNDILKEEWRPVIGFPDYEVSNLGRVFNKVTERYMVPQKNQQGILNVGISRDKVQHKRSLARLVANAFLQPLETPTTFDTPIHLDGDLTNCRVDNLMWRPRWFAVKYHKQFRNNQRGFLVPIEEIHTGEQFETSWDAATKYGLIDKEIRVAAINRTYVWPTYQAFRVLDLN